MASFFITSLSILNKINAKLYETLIPLKTPRIKKPPAYAEGFLE